ncbi:hypothetical protein [Tautonia plasticadhaerens]|uniref:Uncharacterized protein n=1 Tax=Tautonia plasticadhaerens TaxID=2527974 RepID=A0A518GYB4_9BACT|nr:hypothetical protein [Tautonia plasticadhaerens]QDV33591.1 hypothetical protein ElP_14650 [Tautonia plasticadhaerens]
MRNGGRLFARPRRSAGWLVVVAVGLAAVGCAQKRQGLLGGTPSTARPKSPGLFSARPEPGLRVRAPFTDVDLMGRGDEGSAAGEESGAVAGLPEEDTRLSSKSPRVGLFRDSSSGRSLDVELPVD